MELDYFHSCLYCKRYHIILSLFIEFYLVICFKVYICSHTYMKAFSVLFKRSFKKKVAYGLKCVRFLPTLPYWNIFGTFFIFISHKSHKCLADFSQSFIIGMAAKLAHKNVAKNTKRTTSFSSLFSTTYT